MPSIYAVMTASIKQEDASILHFIFAMEISFKKQSITIDQKEFLEEQFFSLPDCHKWRDLEHHFMLLKEPAVKVFESKRCKEY